MEENRIETDTQKVIKISKKKLLVAIIVIVAALFVWNNNNSRYYYEDIDYLGEEGETTSVDAPAYDMARSNGMMYQDDVYYSEPLPPYYDRDVDIADTREFLKTNYSANIYTKDVKDTVDKVEYAIRSVDGRIDGLNSSNRHGTVSFVIAKSDLSEFRDEIEKIAHVKLYTENISSENLLFEKQDIEGRTETTVESLDEAEQAKRNLDQSHNERIDYWTAQILALQLQLGDVVYEEMGSVANGDFAAKGYDPEEEELMRQIIALQQKQLAENMEYSYKNKNIVGQINNLGGNLEVLEEEDLDFMNDVETVEGYVRVEWISCWEKLEKLSPTPMWANTIVLVLIIWWILRKKNIIPKVQLV